MALGGLMQVLFGDKFKAEVKNYPENDRLKIFQFIKHVAQHGLTNLEGRNKSSNDISDNDPNFAIKIAKVNEYNLWHYHIGIVEYEKGKFGDKVSEYVLHYMRNDDHIKIVDMGDHHPIFKLPTDKYLQ